MFGAVPWTEPRTEPQAAPWSAPSLAPKGQEPQRFHPGAKGERLKMLSIL